MLTRLLIVGLLSLSVLHAQAQPRPRPRRIFISVDMEGISGVVQPAQLAPGGFEYQSAREWMTGEVNAAIAGIRDAGARPRKASFNAALPASSACRSRSCRAISRSDAHNVKGTFKDMTEIAKLLQVVSSLEVP